MMHENEKFAVVLQKKIIAQLSAANPNNLSARSSDALLIHVARFYSYI